MEDGDRFEMVVIGAGPAGEKAAAQAAYFGHRVAIVEREAAPGGAPVQSAGVPTKTLRETALYVTGFRQRDVYGVGLQLDPFEALQHLRQRSNQVVRTMTSVVSANIERHGIALIRGTARLEGGGTVAVTLPGGGTRRLRADVVLIATGSRPAHPPGVSFEDPDILDSETILRIDRPFASLVVIGGGAVGCEYASIFGALGVDVTLVDRAARLLPFLDGELSDLTAEAFRGMGIRVLPGAGRAVVERDPEGLRVALESGEVLRPEKVLAAAGRVGNTEGLGLKEAGVETDARGRVVVDSNFRTTAAGIYAAGDVIGPPALASVSMEQGRVAACHAFGIPFKGAVDTLPPFGVYAVPEVAMVGLTEEAARADEIDYEVGKAWFARNTRALIAGSTEGLVKLVFRRDDKRLLGVHILGASAAEMIHLGQAVVHFGGTIDYFIDATFNVPTESEAYKYAAYDGLQRLGTGVVTNGSDPHPRPLSL
ncbi:MAG: Si-specific NAD(P)(+) transhydrogenase [Dehalococcoidia bacterium]|nr:Si-specific NAD(P)(+) transhydrogenase [Dehalococcoidia bacterium]MCB9486436.1 Si-specific NAD(P)(+) transhydrogenase [Thermoflexaceae bacterium]